MPLDPLVALIGRRIAKMGERARIQIEKVPPEQVGFSLGKNRTVGEILQHVVGVEQYCMDWAEAIRRGESSPPPLPPPDSLPPANDFAGLRQGLVEVRAATLRRLPAFTAEDLFKSGVHPGLGARTIEDLLSYVTEHTAYHLGQLAYALELAPTSGVE